MNGIDLLKNLTHTAVYIHAASGEQCCSLNSLEEELLHLYDLEFSFDKNFRFFEKTKKPLIQQDSRLLFWICAPELKNDEINCIYTIGPFADSIRTVNSFACHQISPSLLHYLTCLPVTPHKQMCDLATALYQTLNLVSAPVIPIYPQNFHDAPASIYTNDSFILGSARSYKYEKILIEGIQKGLSNDSITEQLNNFAFYRLGETASFQSYKNYFIGIVHHLSYAVCEAGVPDVSSFLICDYYIQTAESCKNAKELDQLWYPLREAYVQLVQAYQQHRYLSKPVRAALDYIWKNMREKFVLADVAAEIGYHPYYLSRLFHEEIGMTISEYVNNERLHQATFYLSYTSMDLLEISNLVGFSSQSSFSTAFKKRFNMTPTQFRSRCY